MWPFLNFFFFFFFFQAFLEDVSVTQPLDNTQTASTPANADPLAVYTHPQQARRRTVRCLGLLLMAIGLLGCGAIIFRDVSTNLPNKESKKGLKIKYLAIKHEILSGLIYTSEYILHITMGIGVK